MKELLIKTFRDDDFIRGKVPMTKESVRHLSVIKLGLCEGDTVYDIGSGTGSIACEAAAQSGSLEVYAIEMKLEACDLIRQNAAKFGLSNIKVVEGKAPAAFDGLPAPSCAFIGGSSGNLKEILTSLSSVPKGVRVVINAVSLETMAEIQSVLKEFELRDLSIEQISVSKARELGSYHLMTAENPVMIASFTLGGRE
ncbi:MAG: precorrin-6Y C5,15-methyltransferase (decarboxylating) subunit CbiT [Mogibacterium sp.]|nr:precorrin-6Y C5,15-methyltransferase (decarboxylating) subunit CbiT [Mogibacterium sp.]